MNLGILKGVSELFGTFDKIYFCKRIDDNALLLNLQGTLFLIDLTRSKSGIYSLKDTPISAKNYQAPFDNKLKALCTNAKLLDSTIDGDNRILELHCANQNSYKQETFSLTLELTGKYTNAILLNQKRVVLESLRHITQSLRQVQVGKVLSPLPQPTNAPKNSQKVSVSVESLATLYDSYLQDTLTNAKQSARKSLESKRQKLLCALDSLPNQKDLDAQSALFGFYAKSILARIHTLAPHSISAPSLSLNAPFDDLPLNEIPNATKENLHAQKAIQIPILEGSKSPSHLAQQYFAQSKKLSQKSHNLHIQIQNIHDSLAFLQAQSNLVANALSLQDIKIYTQKEQKNKKNAKKGTNFEVFSIQGFKIGIGKNAKQNQELLKLAHADDMWMHIRDIPSSHLIIFCGKARLSEEVIHKAGEILIGLCALHSGSFSVDYTQRRFVKIMQGANVIYAKHKTLELRK